MSGKGRVALFGAHVDWLVNLRGPFIRELAARGHEVIAICPPQWPDDAERINALGARFRPLNLKRTSLNPLADIAPALALRRVLKEEKPDAFFCYGAKPIVLGLPVARSLGIARRGALITGLGYAFTPGEGLKRRIVHRAARLGYWAALKNAHSVIFQNDEDRQDFFAMKLLKDQGQTTVVAGSGVDLDAFKQAPLPDGAPVFLLIARLLYDKGVAHYADAARAIQAEIPGARFLLAGPLDPNPAGVPKGVIDQWVHEGLIEYLGALRDVRPAIAQAHVFVLPTYYREGTPRTVLEALAMGRPVITTDAPGCRHTIRDPGYGTLIPPKDSAALGKAMLDWAHKSDLDAAGDAARAAAEKYFDAQTVAREMADAFLSVDIPATGVSAGMTTP